VRSQRAVRATTPSASSIATARRTAATQSTVPKQKLFSATFLARILKNLTALTSLEVMIVTLMLLTAATIYARKHGGIVWQACVCDRTVDEAEEEQTAAAAAAAAATEDQKEQ
jgi:hypothetical protein